MERHNKRIPYKESWNPYGKLLRRTLKKGTISIAGAPVGIASRDEIFRCSRPP
ncbi:MAG: hypothetical protein ACFFAN_11025 [Promethearchaeota archaeon]